MLPRLFFLLALVLAPCAPLSAAALGWPETSSAAKPWTRWWWLGSMADPASLTAEMEQYSAAGLGGLELTPIYGVRGMEDRFVPFLSDDWMKLLDHTLSEAQRLGLGVDLANGTGWPFGGPWIDGADAAHYLAHHAYTVAPGSTLSEPIAFQQPGVLRFAGPRRVSLAELRRRLESNPDLQDLALDQVRFPQALPLLTLMAFPASGPSLDLTDRVQPDGTLRWTAPVDRGAWTLHALFQGPHGKRVERAAPGGEGYALDHLSAPALHHYLARFDTAFSGHDLRGLRAFFNDSYEVDDAEGEADFTPAFLEEFQRRRGYDLRKQIPALFDGADTRVLSDYRETVSDLLRDGFTKPWRAWAQSHHALIRNQAHGAPANLLDLYAASDIPEQEGSDVLAIKLASSAAHVTGKPLVSAETGTWLNEHFLGTLAELKEAVDTDLLGGVNHVVYHGTAFSPLNEPWPGFQFYAAVELNPHNPFWDDFAILNAGVTRVQSFLQSGQPDEDVLLYYNIHDRWAERGDGRLPHFHGGARDGIRARETAAALRAAGIGFDYVSDRLLAGVRAEGKRLAAGPVRYTALIVPPTEFMPAATLAHLIELAKDGATILIQGQFPRAAPGFQASAHEFSTLLDEIRTHASTHDGLTTTPMGRGRFVSGGNLPTLLRTGGGVSRETLVDLGLEFVRRRSAAGHLYFLVNRSPRAIDGWVPLRAAGESAALYDPMTGAFGLAAFRSSTGDPTESEVYLQLAPGASLIVELHTDAAAGPGWTYSRAAGGPQPVAGEWSVTFNRGGPNLPPATKLTALKSWTEIDGKSTKAFSGTATYSIPLPRPNGEADAWRLDLGIVCDSARVRLNGRELAGLLQPPWHVTLPAADLREHNTLEVVVTNLAANRIADLDRRGVQWKRFYNVNFPARRPENTGPDGLFTAARWNPRNSGLLGPVTLTPLVSFRPSDRPH